MQNTSSQVGTEGSHCLKALTARALLQSKDILRKTWHWGTARPDIFFTSKLSFSMQQLTKAFCVERSMTMKTYQGC